MAELLNKFEVGDSLGLSPASVDSMRRAGCPSVWDGQRFTYRLEEVAAWRRSRGMNTAPRSVNTERLTAADYVRQVLNVGQVHHMLTSTTLAAMTADALERLTTRLQGVVFVLLTDHCGDTELVKRDLAEWDAALLVIDEQSLLNGFDGCVHDFLKSDKAKGKRGRK